MHAHAHLSPEQWRLIERQLEPSESVNWADQPVPRFFTPLSTLGVLIGLGWTAAIYFFFVVNAHPAELHNPIYLSVALFFFSFGLYWALMPVMEYRRTCRTIYALTYNRAIHLENRRKIKVQSYPFNTVTQIRLVEQSDAIGDVVIVCGVRHEGLPPPFGGDPGFYHIRHAEEVAQRFEALLKEEKTAAQLERAPILVWSGPHGSFTKRSTHLIISIIVFVGVIVLGFGTPALLAWVTNSLPAGFFFFLFLLLIIAQIRTMILANQSSRWPAVKGIITDSYVHTDEDSDRPRVKYRYSVDGKEYFNNIITLSQRSEIHNLKRVESVVSRYPEGSSVTVYYHPKSPGNSVIDPGRGAGNWIGFGVIFILLVASTIWVTNTWEGISWDSLLQKWQQVIEMVNTTQVNARDRVKEMFF